MQRDWTTARTILSCVLETLMYMSLYFPRPNKIYYEEHQKSGTVRHTGCAAIEFDAYAWRAWSSQIMERRLRQVGPKREAGPKYQNLKALHLPHYQLKRGDQAFCRSGYFQLKESPNS
jgi:hypothetical protein